MKRYRTISELEAISIESALKRNKNSLSNTARDLGIGRSTLYKKIKDYNIDQFIKVVLD